MGFAGSGNGLAAGGDPLRWLLQAQGRAKKVQWRTEMGFTGPVFSFSCSWRPDNYGTRP